MSAAEKDINTALSSRLADFQTAGSPPIAWENSEYTPVHGTLYLRENFLPNIKVGIGLEDSSTDDYEGIYQVTVVDWRGNRRFDAQEQGRLISVHFPRGAEYTHNGVKVRITSSNLAVSSVEEANYVVPVTISWRAFV